MVAKTTHFALHRNVLTASAPLSRAVTDAAVIKDKDAASRSADGSLFPSSDIWLGAMVPKRWAKRAVTRNAIKRQIYTVSAEFSPSKGPAAFVVRLRKDFSRKEFISASSDVLKAVVRSELLELFQLQPPGVQSSRRESSSSRSSTR